MPKPIDPGAGRKLWAQLCERAQNESDAAAQQFRQWIFESVLLDLITNRIAADDQFAVVVGQRIQQLFTAEQRMRALRRVPPVASEEEA